MYANLITFLSLPILSGFLILTKTPWFCFSYKSKDHNRLILDSIVAGLVFLVTSYLIVTFCEYLASFMCEHFISFVYGPYMLLKEAARDLFQGTSVTDFLKINKYAICSISLAVIVLLGCLIWKVFWTASYYDYCTARRLKVNPNSLESLVVYSFQNFKPIMLNLKNRKVYVGFITDLNAACNLNDRKFMTMLPIASGVRCGESMRFSLMNRYDWPELVEDLEFSEEQRQELKSALTVSMAISVDEINSATVWIPSVYDHFKDNDE